MTALLAAESGKMKERVLVSNEAVRVEGSAIYLKPGKSEARGFSIRTYA